MIYYMMNKEELLKCKKIYGCSTILTIAFGIGLNVAISYVAISLDVFLRVFAFMPFVYFLLTYIQVRLAFADKQLDDKEQTQK